MTKCLMQTLGLEEAVVQLAKANSVCRYGYANEKLSEQRLAISSRFSNKRHIGMQLSKENVTKDSVIE